jgi:peptidoglycan/LPS O-acetylase OafA/YrhL
MLRQFYCRRFLRIFPLYYFLLTVLWLAHYEPVRGGAVWFFSYLTDFYFGHAGVWNSAVGHLWSLAVEEQFYLLWPFLVLWTPPRLLPWVAGAMIAFSPTYRGVASALGMSEGALWVSPFSCLDALGLGSLLAIGARLGWGDRLPRLALPAGIAALMLLVLCRYKFPAGVQPLWSLGPALLSVWLVGSAAKGFGGGIGKVASWRPVLWIGTISYGVYVYHLPVLMLWHRSGLQAPQMIVALIVTAATVGVAAVSWYAFEKPINNLKRLFPYSPARERSRARSTGGDDVEIEKLDQQSWTQSAARFADYNFRQSWHYGIAAAARRGARCEHVAVRYRGDVISLTDVRVKRAGEDRDFHR